MAVAKKPTRYGQSIIGFESLKNMKFRAEDKTKWLDSSGFSLDKPFNKKSESVCLL